MIMLEKFSAQDELKKVVRVALACGAMLPAFVMAREITSVSYDPGTKSATVELTADEGGDSHVIYWAWSEDLQDKGAQIEAWPNVVRVCRVAADEPVDRAFAQIRAKNYAAPYLAAGKPIWLVGLSFDSETRQLVDCAAEQYSAQ